MPSLPKLHIPRPDRAYLNNEITADELRAEIKLLAAQFGKYFAIGFFFFLVVFSPIGLKLNWDRFFWSGIFILIVFGAGASWAFGKGVSWFLFNNILSAEAERLIEERESKTPPTQQSNDQ